MTSNVPAVVAAIRILERLAADWPTAVAPAVLIEELELNRSTCYNLLSTLQRSGWASSLTDRAGWTLGPRLLTLTGVSNELVTRVLQEELEDLGKKLGYTAFAVERDGSGGYTVIARAERITGIRVTIGVGDSLPFSAPALLLAFGAWVAPDELDRQIDRYGLTQFTSHTVTTRQALADRIVEVRRRGYSMSLQEMDMSRCGVAAAVFNNAARAVFGVAVLAFASEMDRDRANEVGRLTRMTADRITDRTGGVFPEGYPTRLNGQDAFPGHAGSQSRRAREST